MALSLSCACGVRFEVEETFAGQTVGCPECQQPVTAPAVRGPVRTSGLAIASVVCALVLAFTGIGTVLAVLLGLGALARISANRGQLSGTGYALFGILWGLLFTGLFAFAVFRGEVFGVGDVIRERTMGHQVDRSGPLEVRPEGKGYSITRPTAEWGVANEELRRENSCDFALVHVGKAVQVSVADEWSPQGLDERRRELVKYVKDSPSRYDPGEKGAPAITRVVVRSERDLPQENGLYRSEVLCEMKIHSVWHLIVYRLVQVPGSNRIFILTAEAPRRSFQASEAEIRQVLDSFRVLND